MENRNHMSEVAKMLGVELGEEFDVRKFDIRSASNSPYKLADNGMVDCEGKVCDVLFRGVIAGRCEIIKKPWKPKYGELFCYIHTDSQGEYLIAHSYWRNDTQDKGLYALGNFFKTEEEALDNLKSYKEFVESLTPNMSWRNS